jgi:hypothetical protein
MSHMLHKLIHAVGHQAAHQYSHAKRGGLHKRANAYGLIAVGCLLLPIPIIGLPLLLWGCIELWSSRLDGRH